MTRYAPIEELADFVESLWIAAWNLGKERHDQEVLASGTVAAVVDSGRYSKSGISGPATGVFVKTLTGNGRAFGIKFRPAGIRGFSPLPVSTLTNARLPFAEVFGPEGASYEQAQLEEESHSGLLARASEFLVARNPVLDPAARVARTAYEIIADNPDIQSTSELAETLQMTERRLQRLFKEFLGVTPKWAIRRHRFQEVLGQLQSGHKLDLTRLAVGLGYYDQAHFNHEFKATMGCSPSSFVQAAQDGAGPRESRP